MSITTTLSITGMSCQNCVAHAKTALLSVPGVELAEVTLQPGQALVTHAEDADISSLLAALDEEGYPSQIAE